MALFGGKNKKNSKKAKKRTVAEAMGVNVSRAPTESEQVEKALHDQVLLAYGYVRDRIDKGCHAYYVTGQFDKLEEFVARPALDAICDRLHTLRNANIYWQQPDRGARTQPQLRVIPAGLKLDANGRPSEFIVEERFVDHSVHKRLTDAQTFVIDSECAGEPRVIQSRITVRNGQDFKLVEVIEVKGATL